MSATATLHRHAERNAIKARAEPDLLNLFEEHGGRRRGKALYCLFHEDKNPSASIRKGRYHCFACNLSLDVFEFIEKVQSTDFRGAMSYLADRYGIPLNNRTNGNSAGATAKPKPTKSSDSDKASALQEIARYAYENPDGTVLHYAVRFRKPDGAKTFRQCRPDGRGGFIWNLDGIKCVPYHLPQLLANKERTVFLPEGEKDCHTLEAWGFVASCNPGGAGGSDLYSQWGDYFRGRDVVIPIDNDESGRKHALRKAEILLGDASSVRILELPDLPEKGDVTDWRDAGGTSEQFYEIVHGADPLDAAALEELRKRWGLTEEEHHAPADTSKDTATPTDEPRAGAKPGVAKGVSDSSAFRLTDDGVFFIDHDPEKEPLKICGPLDITASTRDGGGDAWGCLLRWRDRENRQHEWAMPYSLLAGDGAEYRARLLDGGLLVAPGTRARQLLTTYLQTARPQKLALCVARIGWHGDSFVLPGATIGPEGTEPVLFQTAFESEHYLNIHGSVEEWRNNVGRYCRGNSRLILAASCAFAGPLLLLAGGESGGIHFVGPTSTGKSTALVVGSSVLGGGGQNGFVRTWRATTNGLEAVAELHNGLCLFLDELAQVDARDAAETAYLLGNGTGKSRMSRNIGARKNLQWNLLFVSAGEITLAEHAQTVGKRVKGGAEVRLLNIDADAGAGLGLFENLHGAESADAFARQRNDAARRFYGAPPRTYLEYLVRNRAAVEKAIRSFQADFLSRHVPADASGEVFRAAQRFAVIATAGELATDAGITGWKSDEAIAAAARCLESWIAGRGTAGAADAEAAIRQVKSFIEVNGSSRFQPAKPRVSSGGEPIPDRIMNRAGFRVDDENGDAVEYLVLEEVFRGEVSKGFDHQFVARTLRDRGYLNTQPPHLTKKRPLPEVGDVRVYSVSPSILEA